MERFLFSFWWLIFPIMGMGMGALGMLTGYRIHRDRMELMKTYVEQGKDPAEIAKVMGATQPGPGYPGAGPYGGPWGGGWGYGYSRWGYWGPFREWRRAVIFACIAGGFWFFSQYGDVPYGAERAFTVVAVIMGVLAVASVAFALIATVMAASMSKHDK